MRQKKRNRFSSLKYVLREYFTVTRSQRNGNLVLIALIFLGVIIYYSLPHFIKPKQVDNILFAKEVAEFEASLKPKDSAYYARKQQLAIKQSYDTLKLFQFNPNTATAEEFKRLGLYDKQIRIIQNFLKKGGSFKTKGDFRKLYGLPENQFLFLEPYLNLPTGKDDKPLKTPDLSSEKENNTTTSLFNFNPNTTTAEDWKKLGMSDKQIQVISNYLAKGGKFRTKEDFKKIYSIKPEQYSALEPFITIPEERKPTFAKTEITVEIFDINSATAEDLKKIPGIGDYLSQAIVKYRNLLGGYSSINQINEVYGMKPETFDKIRKNITATGGIQRKIKINFATLDELKNHPYIGKEKARRILEFKQKKGKIKDSKLLETSQIFSAPELEKCLPYLSF